MSKEHAPLSRKEEEEKKAAEAQPQSDLSSGKFNSAFNRWMDKRSPIGNGSRFKKKSTVSQPGDASEMQADAVAKAITEGNANVAQVELQNDVTSGEITAKASDVTIETPPGFDEKIKKMKGGGLPLPDDKKANLEEMLGTDLDHVRLHTGSDAAELSAQINAFAFATGDDIFYPGDLNDEELLAHEVTHTLQDSAGIGAKINRQDNDEPPRFQFQISFTQSMNLEQTMLLLFQVMYGINDSTASMIVDDIAKEYGALNNFWVDKSFDGVTYTGGGEPQKHNFNITQSTFYKYKAFVEGKPYDPNEIPKERDADSLNKQNSLKHGTYADKKEYKDLISTVDDEFRKRTGFKGRLDPNNPDHAAYLKIWYEIMDAELTKKSVLKGDNEGLPDHVKEFLKEQKGQITEQNYDAYLKAINLLSQLSEEEWQEYKANAKSTDDIFAFLEALDSNLKWTIVKRAFIAELEKWGNATPEYYKKFPTDVKKTNLAYQNLHNDPFLVNDEEFDKIVEQTKTQWAADKQKKEWVDYLNTEDFVKSVHEAFILKRQGILEEQLLNEKMKINPLLDETTAKNEIESDAKTEALSLMSADDKKVYQKVKLLNTTYEAAYDELLLSDATALINAMAKDKAVELDKVLITTKSGKSIPDIQKEIKALRPGYKLLYHPISGIPYDKLGKEEKEEVTDYEKNVKSDLQKLEDPTYRGQLREKFIERYSSYKVLDKEMDYPFFLGLNITSLKEMGDMELDKKGNPVYITTIRKYLTVNQLTHTTAYMNTVGMRSLQLKSRYETAKGRFESISRFFLLNEDPGYVERIGFWGKFWEALGENTFWESIRTDDEIIADFAAVMIEEKIPLTEQQLHRLEATFGEKAGALVGALIPTMLEMIVATIMLNPIAEELAAVRAMRILKVVLSRRYGKLGEFAYKAFAMSSKSALIFGITDAGAIRGAAFGTGMAVTEVFNPFRVMLSGSRWGKFASLFYELIVTTSSQLVLTYASDYVQYLADNKFDYRKAFEDTFGRTYDEGKDKLLLTGLMCALFSGAANKNLLKNIKSAIEKMPEKTWSVNDIKKIMGIIAERINLVKNKITGEMLSLEEVKAKLPKELIDAIKSLGKTEDDILRDYQDYHYKDKFFTVIANAIKKTGIEHTHAHTVWSYTCNFFYKTLNQWLREGINEKLTEPMKKMLLAALEKMPEYSGEAYRAIELRGDALARFLAEHTEGAIITTKEFMSCGSNTDAAFFNKKSKNIFIKFEKLTAPDISNFADGIEFRGYSPKELLVGPGKKCLVKEYYEEGGNHHFTLIEQ